MLSCKHWVRALHTNLSSRSNYNPAFKRTFGTIANDFWSVELLRIDRPSAANLIPKLATDNALGYAGARDPSVLPKSKSCSGSIRVVDMACGWKRNHPESVLLVRMGDFYEAWGIDAVMLVQYAGLNPMGDSCRAGCPKANIQQTLNALTDAGLSVAVYEEANLVGSRSKKIKKERYLSQVVTPGRPIYLHDTCLKDGELPYRSARPYAAIQCSSGDNGCSLALFSVDSRELRIHESTTIEAIGSILEGVGGVSSPMWVSADSPARLSRLNVTATTPTRRFPISLTFESFLAAVSSDLTRMLALDKPFVRTYNPPASRSLQPLHFVAAQFLGVTKNSHNASPDLVRNLLPPNAPFHCEYFLRNWLLCPPADAGVHMHALLASIIHMRDPIPSTRVVPVDKLVRLLETRNGNFNFFLDLYHSCDTFVNTPKVLTKQNHDLLTIVNRVSGLRPRSMEELEQVAKTVQSRIRAVIVITDNPEASQWTGQQCESLDRFSRSKEGDLFKQVRGDYALLNLARDRLENAVSRSLTSPDKSLKYDALSDKLYVKDIEMSIRQTGDAKKRLIPEDTTRKRWSTDVILKAEGEYRDCVEQAREGVRKKLQDLCDSISSDMNLKEGLILFSHWAVVLSSAVNHATHATRRGWVLPKMGSNSSHLANVWPYWLDPGPIGPGVGNDVTLDCGKTSVLTAPNMSGKSTLIRSVGAAALLGNSGLMIPAKSDSVVGQFKSILIVSPNGDKPVEGMSAFGAEAEAMSVSLREVALADKILLLVDEFGRGTSGRDASSLSGAVLEFLSKRENVACIWATHLHELFEMKSLNGLVDWVQMDGFKLLSGKCTDSKGIETARERGFPEGIVKEAFRLRDGGSLADRDDVVDDAIDVCPVKRIHARLFTSHDGLIEIPKGHNPPPSISSSPLVYILRFSDQFYIGETENFNQRLKAHRARFDGIPDQIWILKQSNRSRARAVESALIRAYLEEGVALLSTVDGFHNHSVAAN